MFSDHQDWPLWMGMLSHAHSVHSVKPLCLCTSVAIQKLEVLIHRNFSIQSISKAFKAIQRFFRCIIFYFYAPPYTFQLPYTLP